MIRSRGTTEFWRCHQSLPEAVRRLARRTYRLWTNDVRHPSLRFKKITPPNWAVRVGDHYRAVGKFVNDDFVWDWIGTHEEYNKRH